MDLSNIEILNSWAQQGYAQNLLTKALNSATGVGEALSPQSLEEQMTMTIQRISPEIMILMKYGRIKQIASKFHEFNRITSLPLSGSAMGESTTTPSSNSAYSRYQVELKKFRRKGQVTDFTGDISRKYVDIMKVEMENQIRTMTWDIITSMYFGNATANPYDIDGLETLISTNRNGGTFGDFNVRGGLAITSLSILDDMIDASDRKGGFLHPRVIYASPELVSRLTRYETTVRKNVDLSKVGFSQITIPGGYVIETYRGVPIIKTTGLSPIETMTPTITLTSGGTTGGHLSDGTYYIQIAPITNQGEQLASAEQSITLSGGGTTQYIKIALSVRHPNALAYKIYMSGTAPTGTVGVGTAAELLVRQVAATLYSSDGTLDLTASTTGNGVGVGNEICIYTATASAEVPAHMQADPPLVAAGGIAPEYMILQDLDPIQGLGELVYTNIETGGVFGGFVTSEPLAKVDAYRQFLLYSHFTLTPTFEGTSVLVRGIRRY